MRQCEQQCQMMDKLLLWLPFIEDHQGRGEQEPRAARCFISGNTNDVVLVVTIKTGNVLLCPGTACYSGPHICTVQPW